MENVLVCNKMRGADKKAQACVGAARENLPGRLDIFFKMEYP